MECSRAAGTLRDTTPLLNPELRFFTFRGARYAHLAALPHPLAYLAVGGGMESLLGRCNGHTGLAALAAAGGLEEVPAGLVSSLLASGLLLEGHGAGPPTHRAPEARPTSAAMWLFPTTRCNLRCTYCYARGGALEPRDLPADAAAAAVDSFFGGLPPSVRAVQLLFHGDGEPTLALDAMRHAWERFSSTARARGLASRHRLTTNGAFGGDALEWLLGTRPYVAVSLDGVEDVQDRLRPHPDGSGSFSRVTSNLRALVAGGVGTVINATVTRSTLGRMAETVALAAELGVSRLHLDPCRSAGRGRGSEDAEPDAAAFVDELLDALALGLRVGVNVTSKTLKCFTPGDGRYCGACFPLFAVTPHRSVTACPEAVLPGDPAGAVFHYGRIDEGGAVRLEPGKLEKLRGRTGDAIAACRDCFLLRTCGGGCPAQAFLQSGTIFQRDEYQCRVIARLNATLIAAVARGDLVPAPHLHPRTLVLGQAGGPWARLVTLAPPGHPARDGAWSRPFLPAGPRPAGGADLALAPGACLSEPPR